MKSPFVLMGIVGLLGACGSDETDENNQDQKIAEGSVGNAPPSTPIIQITPSNPVADSNLTVNIIQLRKEGITI